MVLVFILLQFHYYPPSSFQHAKFQSWQQLLLRLTLLGLWPGSFWQLRLSCNYLLTWSWHWSYSSTYKHGPQCFVLHLPKKLITSLSLEPPNLIENQNLRPADVMIPGFNDQGRALCVDVAIVGAVSLSHLTTMQSVADKKYSLYLDLCRQHNLDINPIVMDSYDSFHSSESGYPGSPYSLSGLMSRNEEFPCFRSHSPAPLIRTQSWYCSSVLQPSPRASGSAGSPSVLYWIKNTKVWLGDFFC